MSNQEVVNFIERFRKSSLKKVEGSLAGAVTVRSRQALKTNIAHLLCEEARYRWLGLVKEEDVMIDDISCVVLELASLHPHISSSRIERSQKTPKLPRKAQLTSDIGIERQEVPLTAVEATFDGLDEMMVKKTEGRKDPLRSSVV
jgi:hypothetical protein